MKKLSTLLLIGMLIVTSVLPVGATGTTYTANAVEPTYNEEGVAYEVFDLNAEIPEYNLLPDVGTAVDLDEYVVSEQPSFENSSEPKRTKIFGDVNYDGEVKASDVLHLMDGLAGSFDIDNTFGDINYDGSIDMIDVATLQRHVAGWSGYEKLPYGKEVYAGPSECMPDVLYYEPLPDEGGFLYNTLTSAQQAVYEKIVTAIENMDTTAIPTGFTDLNELRLVYYSVRKDHPEYFWLGQGFGYTVSAPHKLLLKFSFTEAEKDAMSKEIQASLQKLVDHIGDTDYSDYELELRIHDYLIANNVYDDAAAASGSLTEYPYAWNIYGALVKNTSVCEGYAESLMLALRMFGIEAGVVTGSNHMWNLVKLDGEYYYVDPTWNDGSDDQSYIGHYYFNLTHARTSAAHAFYVDYADATDSEIKSGKFNIFAPVCTATKYNYYVYNDAVLTGTSTFIDDIAKVLKKEADAAYKANISTITVSFYIDPSSDIVATGQFSNIMSAINKVNSQATGYSATMEKYYRANNDTEIRVPLILTRLS